MNIQIYENYVVQTVRNGSLTKAAESIGVSQPALSAGISRLEQELGYKIFDRKALPIVLTPEGALYYSFIRDKRVLEADYLNRLEALRGRAERNVSVGGPVAYMEAMGLGAVKELLQSHPEYRVSMCCAPLQELITMAEDGKLNCFICTADELPEHFEKYPIKREKLYLCIPKISPVNQVFSKLLTITEADCEILDGMDFIVLDSEMPLQQQAEEFFDVCAIKVKRRLTVNQVSTAVSAAAMGIGLCIASEDALAGYGDSERFCVYPLPARFSSRCIYIAYHTGMWMPRACRDLIFCLTGRNEIR